MKRKDKDLMLEDSQILFEDNHLIFVNKPAGLLTQPQDNCTDSLETSVKAYIKEKYQKTGNVFLHAVHRLDRVVSGIVLFAKTSKALSRLNASIREKDVEKCYIALCEGHFEKKSGTLEHYLVHDDYKAVVCSKGSPDAKLSILSYTVIEEKDASSLLKITLTTGRYHQIRCQLSASGHPIIGDKKYGSKKSFEGDLIALHHYKMSINHPVTQERLTVLSVPHWVEKKKL
jgi:23S rRNA pseudouridine1911/1915/1917 synthase